MTTVRKLRTRLQIYHAAGKLLHETPYDKLRATQIAEEALISRSGFYLYFSDKDAMVSSYFDFLAKQVKSICDAHRESAEDLNQALIEIITFLQDEELFAGLLGRNSTPHIRERAREGIEQFAMSEVVSYFEMLGFDFEKLILNKADLEYYRDSAVSSIIAIFMRWFARRKAERPERIARIIREDLVTFMTISTPHIKHQEVR
ncbi:TetR/AcrR family transcriptional regulator [Streptococcus sp. zg-JUN1979]|uniref:TetR/AcrR family transcriptional regulator n=1 Tax=Streptococcus sp. zg-JUN1979 TaxID=3391450 RepID=UPI0039A43453